MAKHIHVQESIEDLRDCSISTGTHNSDTLITRFLDVLKTYARDKYDKYVKENPEVLDANGMDDETKGWVVDELFDLLGDIAPEGTYFGALEGDGADFGFWSVDEKCQKANERMGQRHDVDVGYYVTYDDGTVEYYYDTTSQGGVYVDMGAYESGNGICFIPEDAFDGSEFVTASSKSSSPEDWQYSKKDIKDAAFDIVSEYAPEGVNRAEAANHLADVFMEFSREEGWCSPETWMMDAIDSMDFDEFSASESSKGMPKKIEGFYNRNRLRDDVYDALEQLVDKSKFTLEYVTDVVDDDDDGEIFGNPDNDEIVVTSIDNPKVKVSIYKDNPAGRPFGVGVVYNSEKPSGEKDYWELQSVDLDEEIVEMLRYIEELAGTVKESKQPEELGSNVVAQMKSTLLDKVETDREVFKGLNDKYADELNAVGLAGISPVFRPKQPYTIEDRVALNVEWQPFDANGDWVKNDEFIYKTMCSIDCEFDSDGKVVVNEYFPLDEESIDIVANKYVGAEGLFKWVLDTYKETRNNGKGITYGKQYAESKQCEGWDFGWSSKDDMLRDNQLDENKWTLEKTYGTWYCYVNKETGRPLVVYYKTAKDGNTWGVKAISSDMGPSESNIQAAKWLKPRLEQWEQENGKADGYDWDWIERSLGKEAANKSHKDLIKSLVPGDKVQLIPEVANGAVVEYVRTISPSKVIVSHNGREMGCKTSYIASKVGGADEAKQCEAYDSMEDVFRKDSTGESNIHVDLESIFMGDYAILESEDVSPEDNVKSVSVTICVGDEMDSPAYQVSVYDADFGEHLTYSIRDEAGTNLKDYVSASKSAPLGYARKYTPSEAAKMLDDIRHDIESLSSGLQESKQCEKITQKDLKDMVKAGAAVDITNVSDDEAKELRSKGLEKVSVSTGIYGMNGALFQDKDGKNYVITARNSNLFYFV